MVPAVTGSARHCGLVREYEREYIREKTLEGQASGRERGRHGGRPKVFDDDMLTFALALWAKAVQFRRSA